MVNSNQENLSIVDALRTLNKATAQNLFSINRHRQLLNYINNYEMRIEQKVMHEIKV